MFFFNFVQKKIIKLKSNYKKIILISFLKINTFEAQRKNLKKFEEFLLKIKINEKS